MKPYLLNPSFQEHHQLLETPQVLDCKSQTWEIYMINEIYRSNETHRHAWQGEQL